MRFEYYVLNWNPNTRKVEMFNIFQNYWVQERTEKEIKKYLRSPNKYKYEEFCMAVDTKQIYYGFEALCQKIRRIIMSEEWSRCEYEIAVGDAFTTELCDIVDKVEREVVPIEKLYEMIKEKNKNNNRLEKWDCYRQCIPNIPMITREVLWQYKKQLKEDGNA